MADVLREVSKVFAQCDVVAREFHTRARTQQDYVADKSQQCFDAQMRDARWKSYLEGAAQLAAAAYSFWSPNSRNHEMISLFGRTLSSGIFEPRQLDSQNTMRKADNFNAQLSRELQALDQLKQTRDQLESTLAQSIQTSHQ